MVGLASARALEAKARVSKIAVAVAFGSPRSAPSAARRGSGS
ncbi:MAG TPA: hypothetical protein VII08_08830 [Myxococcales bacterium]